MKRVTRQDLVRRRAALSADGRERESTRVAERVRGLPEYRGARVVLGYMALAHEVDPVALLQEAHAEGKRVALPRLEGADLAIRAWTPGDPLVRGRYDLLEPSRDAAPVDVQAIEVVLVPGVGFDRGGHRLGFGGGYYDRLLSRAPSIFRIGLAFEVQVVPRLPIEAHDELMDVVVCASATIRNARRLA